MKYVKILVKLIVKLLKIIFVIVVSYLVVAGICAFAIINGKHVSSPRSQRVFLVSDGVHVGFVLPTKTAVGDWSLILQRPDLVNVPYTYIGWGSEAFYTQVPTWGDLTLKLSSKALFLDSSVLFIHGGYAPQTNYRAMSISTMQLQKLTDDIIAQMKSRKPLLPNVPYFYSAKGYYSPITTCNEWVRQRLAHIGIATPVWSPFAQPILWALPDRNQNLEEE